MLITDGAKAFLTRAREAARWAVLGGMVGLAAGTASALFLTLLSYASAAFMAAPTLLILLPAAGLLIGWAYWRFGGASAQGNNLVLDEIREPRQRIPLRMTPLVLIGTVGTHLFGGSAGREGTAIQMGASLSDALSRLLNLAPPDRRLMLMAGISGGFAAVFGTPAAGFVFGMEVRAVGRVRYDGLLPCLVAALVGDLTTRAWGVGHSHYPLLPVMPIEAVLLLKVALAGGLFGLAALLFSRLTHAIKRLMQTRVDWPPLRPVIGGLLLIVMTLAVGTNDYNGLSLPLIHASVTGEAIFPAAFLLKLVFTAVTIGSGFMGGEVTPLFVIGATLGAAIAPAIGVDAGLLASAGFVAVFAGASNTPLACLVMGIELFGGGALIYLLVACVMAYLVSGHHGIYTAQAVEEPKWRHHRD